MGNRTCLSGQEPIPLSNASSCALGFLCLNTTTGYPPVFCPPTQACQAIRSKSVDNICSMPQGRYEPVICFPGHYCPPGGREQIRCAQGYYCPQGTYNPIQCKSLSICPEGSERELSLVGVVSLAVIYLMWLLSFKFSKPWKIINAWGPLKRYTGRKRARGLDTEMVMLASNKVDLSRSGETGVEEKPTILQARTVFESLIKDRKLPMLGLDFSLQELQSNLSETSRPILQGVSGSITKGRLFGVMGPSGAGKSTFINILAGRVKPTSGSISINGISDVPMKVHSFIGLVPQDDIALQDLTVRENVLHAARVRLGGLWDDGKIRLHVDQILAYLGLTHVMDQLLGSIENRGISGGERKRVCIALGIVAMPTAVILDEPTSGLDATTALSIMTLLKSLSTLGITVICAIHQPRKDIYQLLDDIIVLHLGKKIYLGEASTAHEHFEALGLAFPAGCNPADIIIDFVTTLPSALDASPLHHHQGSSTDCLSISSEVSMVSSSMQTTQLGKSFAQQKAPWYRQLLLYVLCSIKQQRRQVFSLILEIGTGAASGLLIGLSIYEFKGHIFQGYFRQPFDLLSSAVNYTTLPTAGLLCSLAISLSAAPAGIKIIADEKLIFYQDVYAGHSASAYLLGKDLATWPRILVSSLQFTTFYMILATTVIPFHILFSLNVVYFFCIYGLASLVASLVKRQDALLLAMLASLICGILDGFGPRLTLVKSWGMGWLWYMCPGTWYSEAFFSEHTIPFSYLYDVDAAARFVGYVTERTSLDICLILLIGVIYRILAYLVLILPIMDFGFTRKLWVERKGRS